MTNREWYKKKTTWACMLIFIAGGLEAVGISGSMELAKNLAEIIGLPLAIYGVADRVSKK